MSSPRPPPHGVPTLTEVVHWPDAAAPAPAEWPAPNDDGEPAVAPEPAGNATAPVAESAAPLPPVPAELPALTEAQITQRVLSDLHRQIDLMLDYRLREALTPLLARAADALIRDVRNELASTLRDVVARAVAQEMSRHRSR